MDPGSVPAGAVAVPMPPAETKAAHGAAAVAAAAGAVVVVPLAVEAQAAAPGAAAAAAQPAPRGALATRTWSWCRTWTLVPARQRWAKGAFVLGCAAAALAIFAGAMALPPPPADSSSSRLHHLQAQGACVPTAAEAAHLRAASTGLLLAASAQVLAATVALRVPGTLPNLAAWWLGSRTGLHAAAVLGALASCHGRLDGGPAVNYGISFAFLCVLLIVSIPFSIRRRRVQ